MGNLKHGSMVFNSPSQSLESGLYRFHEPLRSFLLPSSVTVVVEWWGCSVTMCLLTSCPLPKDYWWRVTGEDFLSYHITKTFFSAHAGVCFKEHVGSAVLSPIPPLWKLPSAHSVLCALPSVFLLVHLLRVVFSGQVQLVTNQHLGEIFTIEQSSNKKHTFQVQQPNQSKLTHGLKSPKWTGCQTTVSTNNFHGSKVEFIIILLVAYSSEDSLLTATKWSSAMACCFSAVRHGSLGKQTVPAGQMFADFVSLGLFLQSYLLDFSWSSMNGSPWVESVYKI